jgi:hypothetical protein
MYKFLVILLLFISCDSKHISVLDVNEFIGSYKSSEENILDTLHIYKNESFRHVRYNEINNSLIFMDTGIWYRSDNGYLFKNYRFDVKDTNISYANFDPYFGAFNSICMDLGMDGQDKYVKIKK